MVRPLNSAHLARIVDSGGAHAMLVRYVLHLRRQPVAAGRVLHRLQRTAQRGELGAGGQPDSDRATLKRAGQERDYGSAAGPILGVGSVRDACQVPCVLNEHVLEATSGGDQGNSPLAGGAHDLQRSFGVAVRTPGPNHDGGARISHQAAVDRVGRHNADLDARPLAIRCVLERGQSGGTVLLSGGQVDQHRDER